MPDDIVIIPFQYPLDFDRQAGRVVAHLEAGGLIAYPTETVYGFGCALHSDALADLAALKGREEGKPFLLLISEPAQAVGLVWTRAARALAAAFWPGPLTLALRSESGAYPPNVMGPGGAVAVRATPHPGVRALLAALDGPITSTSANRPGQPPAASTAEALAVLRAFGGPAGIWLLDGGTLPPSAPSTVVDCAAERPRIVRAGSVSLSSIREVWKEIDG